MIEKDFLPDRVPGGRFRIQAEVDSAAILLDRPSRVPLLPENPGVPLRGPVRRLGICLLVAAVLSDQEFDHLVAILAKGLP